MRSEGDTSTMRTLTDSKRCAESLVVEDEGRGRSRPRVGPLIPVIASARSQWRRPSEVSSGGRFVGSIPAEIYLGDFGASESGVGVKGADFARPQPPRGHLRFRPPSLGSFLCPLLFGAGILTERVFLSAREHGTPSPRSERRRRPS